MAAQISSLETLVEDVFLVIIEQLLDEEDPALVSTSNKHFVTMNEQFPHEFSGQGPQEELHNPPANLFKELEEKLDNEPQNTLSGIKRDTYGYHHVIKLRSVSKSVKERIDKLPFVAIRKEIAQFFQEKVSTDKYKDFITLGINSEIQIAELQQKWPRILHDYLHRSTAANKPLIAAEFSTLHNRAKFLYNERCEDHNGKVYGKASLLELEFTDVNNEPLKIQVKLVHCWDVRESNWYTYLFIYALNKDRPAVPRPRVVTWGREFPPPKNCLVQLLKDRGWLDLTYYNAELAKNVCKELSLDPAFWLGEGKNLLLEFFLLVAGEAKFTHFVPIVMKNDRRESKVQNFDWELQFERDREPTSDQNKSYLNTIAEFKVKFLLKKIPSGKQGQRYLLNAKIQLGASFVEDSLKSSSLPAKQLVESIASCSDIEISPGEFAHLNAFSMKALLRTHDGGALVVWLEEKAGMGYHTPCNYVTLQVKPISARSAQALELQVGEQRVVYYHFFERNNVVNANLFKKLYEHVGSMLTEDLDSSDENGKKRRAEGTVCTLASRAAKKRRTDDGSAIVTASDEEPDHVMFLTLYNALLNIRAHVQRRLGAFHNERSYFCFHEDPGFAGSEIGKDWK